MKVAISYVSEENARRNLEAELPGWDFDAIVRASADDWNAWLSKIEVSGGTEQQRVKFYTDLWHALLGRRTFSDADGRYVDNTGPEPRIRQVPLDAAGRPTRATYNSDSFWGSQWNLNVLWSFAYPRMMSEQVSSLVDYYTNGGMTARGPAGGNYSFVMIGDQATPLIAAAYNKGIRDFDVEAAYAGAREERRSRRDSRSRRLRVRARSRGRGHAGVRRARLDPREPRHDAGSTAPAPRRRSSTPTRTGAWRSSRRASAGSPTTSAS